MAVSISISITENSWNASTNKSNVTVKVVAKWTGGSYNTVVAADGTPQANGSLTIDGTSYTFNSVFNSGKTTSGSATIFTKTVNISHASDGSKTLSCSAWYKTYVSSGTVSASASKALTTIPLKSTLSVANGTLGTKQTLTVTRKSTSYRHTITYTCGTASGTICSMSALTSIAFTPPMTLASQNTTGTTVSITFKIITYNQSNNSSLGYNTYTKTYAIPDTVIPSCTISSISDGKGYKDTYGAFVQGYSSFKVDVSPSTSYGSPIDIYIVKANGSALSQTSDPIETSVVKSSGTCYVEARVRDKRGRYSAWITNTVDVLPYAKPTMFNLKAYRCTSTGTPDPKGTVIDVKFDADISPLNNKNTVKYTVEYRKTTDSTWTSNTKTSSGYALRDVYYTINDADVNSSYEIKVTLEDDFHSTPVVVTVPSGFQFMSWRAGGKGLAFGKTAELDDTVEFEFDAKFNSPVYGKALGMGWLPSIPSNSDLNDYMTTGCYAVKTNAVAETCANIPVARAGRLEVWAATGEDVRDAQWSYLRQRYIPYNMGNAVWEREVTRGEDNVWIYYDWWRSSLTPAASKKVYSRAAMTIALSANTTLGVVNTYTKLPLSKSVLSTSDRLTLSSNSIRIGSGISYVVVSGQTLIKSGSSAGNRHVRIQKVSGSTTTTVSWTCINSAAAVNTLYSLTPMTVSVKEGDLICMVYYTSDSADMNASGSAANGWQTYLTVEEL